MGSWASVINKFANEHHPVSPRYRALGIVAMWVVLMYIGHSITWINV